MADPSGLACAAAPVSPGRKECTPNAGVSETSLDRFRGWQEFILVRDGRRVRVLYSLADPDHALPAALQRSVVDLAQRLETLAPPRRPGSRRSRLIENGIELRDDGALAVRIEPGRFDIGTLDPATTGPAHVQAIALMAHYALARFHRYGFMLPQDKGPGENDPVETVIALVRKLNDEELRGVNALGGTSWQWRHVEVFNALVGHHALTTVAHELFHRIQYAYYINPHCGGSPKFDNLFMEGTARAIEDIIVDAADNYAEQGLRFFDLPGMPLADMMPFPDDVGARYAGALFWKYVAEQHGRFADAHAGGIDTQLYVLEEGRAEDEFLPYHVRPLRRARSRMAGIGHFDRFLHLDESGDAVLCSETTWGNFLVALALNGTATMDSRFRFGEAGRGENRLLGRRLTVPEWRTVRFDTLTDYPDETVHFTAPVFHADRLDHAVLRFFGVEDKEIRRPAERRVMLNAFAAHAYAVEVPAQRDPPRTAIGLAGSTDETRMLRVRFRPTQGLEDAFVQIIQLDPHGNLIDLIRLDCMPSPYRRDVDGAFRSPPLVCGGRRLDHSIDLAGTGRVLVIVASRERSGDYALAFSRMRACPLVRASALNARPLGDHVRSFAGDPKMIQFSWRSPSIMMDERSVVLQIRNQGDLPARGVVAALSFRPLDEAGPGDRWYPIGVMRQREMPGQSPEDGILPDRDKERVLTGDILTEPTLLALEWPVGERRRTVGRHGAILKATIRVPEDPNRLGKSILHLYGAAHPGAFPGWRLDG